MNEVSNIKHTNKHIRTGFHRILLLAALGFSLLLSGCASEYHLAVTVNDDGSVDLSTRYTLNRAQVEQMVRWSDPTTRMSRHYGDETGWVDVLEDGVVIEERTPQQDLLDSNTPLTDQQIIEGFTELSREKSPLKNIEGITQEMRSVTVEEDTVQAEGATHFDSLELFVKHGTYYWRSAGIESFRLEQDDQGHLVATATFRELTKPDLSRMRRMLKAQKFKGSFRLTLPGAIVSSPLPNAQESQTWFEIDAADNESLDHIVAMFDEPFTIVADPGVLDISTLPLDSEEIGESLDYDSQEQDDPYADIPIVEAPDGYYAEAETLAVSTVVLLPNAKDKLGRRADMFSQEFNNSAKIQAKLYAPENAKLLGVGKVKVQRAIDDQGNEIKEYKKTDAGFDRYGYGSYGRSNSSDDDSNSVSFQVILSLPAPGAEAIEEVEGTLIVTAFDDWSKHRIPRVRANPDKLIDLADILPGATLKIKRYKRHVETDASNRQIQGRFELEMAGPPEISALQFSVEIPGANDVNSYESTNQINTTAGVTKRSTEIQYHEWSVSESLDPDAVTLIISYPSGMRRERVPFMLEALDLY